MAVFTVTEKQNAASQREGRQVEAKDLAEAKRMAAHMQCFFGTVMEVTDEAGKVLGIRTRDGKWV